ncbi:MAG: hypothetical protein M1834_004681 [Cirrosporium novae-zelandiae]|nr:MAG: hypothetical protein M1834_004681 [Cirrosporium novae-zelandiae]
MDLGSNIKVGSVTLLRSAPGRNWEIICDRTVQGKQGVSTSFSISNNQIPITWLKKLSSSPVDSLSSIEDRLPSEHDSQRMKSLIERRRFILVRDDRLRPWCPKGNLTAFIAFMFVEDQAGMSLETEENVQFETQSKDFDNGGYTKYTEGADFLRTVR